MSKSEHKTTKVKYPFYDDIEIDIDIKIAPLIEEIWQAGIDTLNSCENNVPEKFIWIQFNGTHNFETFINIIGKNKTNLINLKNWIYDILVSTRDGYDNNNETCCGIEFEPSIRFPQKYLNDIYNSIKQYNVTKKFSEKIELFSSNHDLPIYEKSDGEYSDIKISKLFDDLSEIDRESLNSCQNRVSSKLGKYPQLFSIKTQIFKHSKNYIWFEFSLLRAFETFMELLFLGKKLENFILKKAISWYQIEDKKWHYTLKINVIDNHIYIYPSVRFSHEDLEYVSGIIDDFKITKLQKDFPDIYDQQVSYFRDWKITKREYEKSKQCHSASTCIN